MHDDYDDNVVVDVEVEVEDLMYYFLIFSPFLLVVTAVWRTDGRTERQSGLKRCEDASKDISTLKDGF